MFDIYWLQHSDAAIISASLSIRIASRVLMVLNIRPSHVSVHTCEQWQHGWLDLDAVWGGECGRALSAYIPLRLKSRSFPCGARLLVRSWSTSEVNRRASRKMLERTKYTRSPGSLEFERMRPAGLIGCLHLSVGRFCRQVKFWVGIERAREDLMSLYEQGRF